MRYIIVSGGTVENFKWIKGFIKKGDRVICVDGGARHVVALGIVPDMVIGDMDSVEHPLLERLAGQDVVIKKYPAEKDDTDTALALAEALSGNPEEIIILGALGTRFDHSLANVHLLRVALEKKVRARIITEYNEISLVAPHHSAVLEGKPGQLFSLLPLTEKVTGVNVSGARWPLDNATFFIGNPYGVSNRLSSTRAEISIDSGLLLVIRVFKD